MISSEIYICNGVDVRKNRAVVVGDYRARLFQATYVSVLYRMPDLDNTYSIKRRDVNFGRQNLS